MEYVYSEKAGEISGFGGGYEAACRSMVIAGMKWLDENPNADISYKEFKRFYGMTTGESPDCLAMQEVMNKALGKDGATGAMMQACTGHVMAAHKMGWEKYMERMEEKETELK